VGLNPSFPRCRNDGNEHLAYPGLMTVAAAVERIVGPDFPIALRAYDGSSLGPPNARTTLVMRSPDAIRRILTAPGELGLGRAYVAGDLDVEGDLFFGLAALLDRIPKLGPSQLAWVAWLVGLKGLRPLPPPPEEARLRGRRHSRQRDAAAIAHHYDVSNTFYRLVLGPSMTYSCAVWGSVDATLEEAQAAKYELICSKLDLREGSRLLDVGCGWGGMAMHAAREHGARTVGVTLSRAQADWAQKAVAEAGLADRVEIRYQDYRDVMDGPFDAISSIGMFEHVGLQNLGVYFDRLFSLLRPGGRLLNHGIARPARPGRMHTPARIRRRSFIDRYVFPDGELHELGAVISRMQASGFEVRHVEGLREHYALTLRAWVRNLERSWEEAVLEAGEAQARIWRLYMAASALSFEAGRTQIHQVLAVKSDAGQSGLPLRPRVLS
jgi:cyclopropane-fatty-acyl-phospholipid synthase